MSRLRAITAKLGAGRKRDPEDSGTQPDDAAGASATSEEQHDPGAGPDEIDHLAAPSDAASLAEFEAIGAALREGGQPAASDAAPAADAAPDGGAGLYVDVGPDRGGDRVEHRPEDS
jgi:hypothetical protein